MQYIDTSPGAIEHRAAESMRLKHIAQIQNHEAIFGKLGQLQTKDEKKALARATQLRKRSKQATS